MTLPPPWEEQRPLGAQAACWVLRFANGASLTAAVMPAGVELWSGPGGCTPVTTNPGDLWALARGAAHLAEALEAPRGPVPEQPTLFDEVMA